MIAVLIAAAFHLLSPDQGAPQIVAYGPVVIDLELGKERSTGQVWSVEDCSSSELQCVNGHYFRLAVPRQCDDWRVGQMFSADGVTTEVLSVLPVEAGFSDLQLGRGRVTLLGSAEQPWVVYVYVGSSLTGLYIDIEKRRNYVDLAREGGLDALRTVDGFNDRDLLPLTTFRGLFPCDD